jgi:uncharacterized NAD(P)/FAD-binding protein YdhS
MHETIVIVGAGFCGTVLAANLLRRAAGRPLEIVLIERSAAVGRGLAYAERAFPYLLNVPAERLSADSRDPLQFLRFARERFPAAGADDFLPRALYGDYLEDFLERAVKSAPREVRLLRRRGEVNGIERGGRKSLRVQVEDQAALDADRVILAVGGPGPPVPAWAAAVREHPRFRQEPWDLPDDLGPEHTVLIIGTGLTMADVIMPLSRDLDRMPMLHSISRRGLLPLPQAALRHVALREDQLAAVADAQTARGLLKASRALATQMQALGGDWRETITALRNLAPGLWSRLPSVERGRFLRHVQIYWDVHRHRMPPQQTARIQNLLSLDKLRVNAGRIRQVHPDGGRLRVEWQPRGSARLASLTVDLVVRAMGPDYSVERASEPLFKSLRANGSITADALHLGLRTAKFGVCLGAHGMPTPGLYCLGPMLRADHWEATAATELRNHAERLAEHLVGGD